MKSEIPYAFFGCGGYHTIKEDELKRMEEIEKEIGGYYWTPICRECGVELTVGDQLDGFHPYCQDYNYCKLCKDHMKKPTEEDNHERFKEAYENKVIILNPKQEWCV